ncbi:uncharacterized protein BX663DRAFT_531466 [Cokeromyces recurvatus]|uniref:uncharacterized protein n=1 Tax=Cokeromyces recurvatus TaxID=90255 RepID=UPI002220D856|nr:uncharacterized protein BX663DRAFT_531466 [Cokeromyces recurvatus]KAI7902079.1 hypothetical protein BX663DRAFT_531466 [Cokeromyces recurvatus]
MSEVVEEPNFLIHQATHLFLQEPIHFQIIQMNKAVFIWIGKADGGLGDMSVAIPPFGSNIQPSATTIFSKSTSEHSKNLAPLKFKQQFYVSLDLSSPDDLLFVFVEKKLTETLKNVM